MKTPQCAGVKCLAHRHVASKWQSQDSNPFGLTQEPVLPATILYCHFCVNPNFKTKGYNDYTHFFQKYKV